MPDKELKQNIRDYLETIEYIQKEITKKHIFSDQDIQNLEAKVNYFGIIWPKMIGSVTLKADDVIFHLIPFIRTLNNIGNYNEENTEKLHAQLNTTMRPLSSLKDKKHKFMLSIKRLVIYRNLTKFFNQYF